MKPALIAFFLLFCFQTFAQWNPDPQVGVVMANLPGDKINQLSVSDGQGGIIVAFVNDFWIYGTDTLVRKFHVQRVDASGKLRWGAALSSARIDSLNIHANTTKSLSIAMVADGSGGVFVTWANHDYPELQFPKAQHIDSAGNLLWGYDGVAVSTFYGSFFSICRSGTGVIIGWNGVNSPGNPSNMFAQRLNEAGVPQWSATGVQLADATGSRLGELVSDGKDGAIAFFMDDRNVANGNGTDIYGQRLDSNGQRKWGTAGKGICTRAGDQKIESRGFFKLEVHNAVATNNGEAVVTF